MRYRDEANGFFVVYRSGRQNVILSDAEFRFLVLLRKRGKFNVKCLKTELKLGINKDIYFSKLIKRGILY